MTNKPKDAKSVRFAPDVRYVCREHRNRLPRRTSWGQLTGDAGQLPAVVEKYMIRSLPVASEVTPTTDSAATIVYVDDTGQAYRGRNPGTQCVHKTRIVTQTSPREQVTPSEKLPAVTSGRGVGEHLAERQQERTAPGRDPDIGTPDRRLAVTCFPRIRDEAAKSCPTPNRVNATDVNDASVNVGQSLPAIGAVTNQNAARQWAVTSQEVALIPADRKSPRTALSVSPTAVEKDPLRHGCSDGSGCTVSLFTNH